MAGLFSSHAFRRLALLGVAVLAACAQGSSASTAPADVRVPTDRATNNQDGSDQPIDAPATPLQDRSMSMPDRACTPPGSAEVCDGRDNDCNGVADDGAGFVCIQGTGASCTTTCGTTGSRECAPDCRSQSTSCVATEVCNGCDDDGDTVADDGFACVRGMTATCRTACDTPGNRVCSDACAFTACAAAAEVCGNGCDDNANGTSDEGCPPPARPTNDACANPIMLQLDTEYAGNTCIADDTTASECATPGSRDVFFRLPAFLGGGMEVRAGPGWKWQQVDPATCMPISFTCSTEMVTYGGGIPVGNEPTYALEQTGATCAFTVRVTWMRPS